MLDLRFLNTELNKLAIQASSYAFGKDLEYGIRTLIQRINENNQPEPLIQAASISERIAAAEAMASLLQIEISGHQCTVAQAVSLEMANSALGRRVG